MSITFGTLYSGSGGNCTVFSDGKDTVLIDAGWNRKHLLDGLEYAGIAPDDIGAIFITHCHSDHIGALHVFLKDRKIPVHASMGTSGAICGACAADMLHRHKRIFSETVGNIKVTSYKTSHDVESVGYVIEDSGRRFGYATDLGVFTEENADALCGCECVILESNHDPEMLRHGPYDISLQKRIRSDFGHLSNEQSACAALKLAANGTKRFILAHISEKNNLPGLALRTSYDALSSAGYRVVPACNELEDGDIGLCVASAAEPVLLRL